MLSRVVLLQRTNVLRRHDSALSFTGPVPPCTQNHLAYLIQRAQVYRSSVSFVDGTSQMEATIASQHNGTVPRLVRLSNNSQTPLLAPLTLQIGLDSAVGMASLFFSKSMDQAISIGLLKRVI